MLGFPVVSLSGDLSADLSSADGLRALQLWQAANSGAAVARICASEEIRVVAWLTVNGAFRHLAEARHSVSLLSGDSRKVFALNSAGHLIKTRDR